MMDGRWIQQAQVLATHVTATCAFFIPDFIKSKEKGKNKDEIRRQNQLTVGEGNKAEDIAETEEHYVNALQMGGLL